MAVVSVECSIHTLMVLLSMLLDTSSNAADQRIFCCGPGRAVGVEGGLGCFAGETGVVLLAEELRGCGGRHLGLRLFCWGFGPR